MSNLDLAIDKYSLEKTTEELINRLQNKGNLPLSINNEYPLFQ